MLLETCQIEVGRYQSNNHEDTSHLQSLMADATNGNLHAKFLDAFEAGVTWEISVHGKLCCEHVVPIFAGMTTSGGAVSMLLEIANLPGCEHDQHLRIPT
jgi:hypothetical protein